MKSSEKVTPFPLWIMVLLLSVIFFSGCNQPTENTGSEEQDTLTTKQIGVVHPDWSKNANIYEVNVRQYTPEGTFAAFEEHLPRLQNMGVKILWFMPIHPIGEKNRKGTLGSYYAVKDYKAVNPEFGTFEDFKALVDKAHSMGFKVILDWVANHTAWDHQWIVDHPEWYTKDSTGQMVAPFDWSDVADLNYDQPALRDAMLDALKFWVADADIDGYRCDVAGMVPTDFWNTVRAELDQIKPVFMLAEAEEAELHEHAFDMTYAWELHHIYNSIAKGEMNANHLETYFQKEDTVYPENAYRMNFITNHDENSWNGTVKERLGDGAGTFAVLSFTLPGMPLLYSGQEVGLNKRLEFFEKDKINWDQGDEMTRFYTRLIELKSENQALWNGQYGGEIERVPATAGEQVFAFVREKNGNKIFTIVNLTADKTDVEFSGERMTGSYIDVFTGENKTFSSNHKMTLAPWAYFVYVSSGE